MCKTHDGLLEASTRIHTRKHTHTHTHTEAVTHTYGEERCTKERTGRERERWTINDCKWNDALLRGEAMLLSNLQWQLHLTDTGGQCGTEDMAERGQALRSACAFAHACVYT